MSATTAAQATGATMDAPERYGFGDCELDLATFTLRRDGQPVHVEPQVFEVLAHLVRNRGRVGAKTEPVDHVWGDRFVGESTLSSRIKSARRAIGDTAPTQRGIRTVHGRGYRFVAPVDVDRATPVVDARPVRPPLVKAANWMTHLDYEADSRVVAALAGRPVATTDPRPLRRARLRPVGLLGWQRDDVFRQVFSSQFLPDAPPNLWRAFNELQRRTTSVENAARSPRRSTPSSWAREAEAEPPAARRQDPPGTATGRWLRAPTTW